MSKIRTLLPTLTLIAGVAALITGCAYRSDDPMAMRGKPYKAYMVGAPYQINGRWYYPKEDFSYNRVGIASWYGTRFDGKRTANGEIYDMDLLTAAHPTLPMPSLVSVTNLANGRNVVVRINDRGPFAENRIIDLSRRAAEDLGLRRKGIGKVQVRILRTASLRLKREALAELAPRDDERDRRRELARLTPENQRNSDPGVATAVAVTPLRTSNAAPAVKSRQPTSAAVPVAPPDRTDPQSIGRIDPALLNRISPGAGPASVGRPIPLHADLTRGPATKELRPEAGRVFVQIGSFTERANALRTGERLRGIAPTRIATRKIEDTVFYRVRVGPVASRNEGRDLLDRIRRKGYDDARIVLE